AALGPKNPRVFLLQGIGTFHKPAFVGGGADKALPLFRKSQELFAKESGDSTSIDWGRDDAWIWSGRAALKLEDWKTARADFAKALEISPGHAWVTASLIPEAEKGLAATSETPAKSTNKDKNKASDK